jgi:Domain of unknown function (DUF4136)
MKTVTVKNMLVAFCAAGMLVLGGCASVPDVRVARDRSADFTQYKTFAFASPLGTDRGGYQSIVSLELKAATQREMEARGMRLVSTSPQLLVNFSAAMIDKTRVSTMPVFIGMDAGFGYYGYRGDLYSPWPLYVDQTVVTQYKEGTLNIDVVDAARKQLVWEGVVTDTVSQKDLQNIAASINVAITAAFARYPIAPLIAVKAK